MKQLTKTLRPEIEGYCDRARLHDRLSQSAPAIWIASPAGSGKTCLVSAYVAHSRRPCVWLHLDEDDQEPATFFHYLTLAVEGVGVRLQDPELLVEYRSALSTFARRYFRRLFAALPARTLIVLDNFEALMTNTELHSCLVSGVRETSSDCGWLILSREGPPSCFAGLEAERRLMLLGWEDMRFTREEALSLVSRSLSPDEAQSWLERAYPHNQGWVAGLLLSLDAQSRGLVESSPGPGGAVFDYFASEVFSALDRETQQVLLNSACLPEFSEDDLKALTGDPKAPEIIEALVQRGYFVSRLPGAVRLVTRERCYRFHPLYRSFLLAQAKKSMAPEALEELLVNSALRLAKKGQAEPAILLLLEAKRWNDICGLLREHAAALLEAGRHDLLSKWLEHVPSELPPTTAGWLSYWHACARLPFDPLQAKRLYTQAFQAFEQTGDPEGLFLNWCGGVESLLYGWGSFLDFDPWFETYHRVLASLRPPSIAIEARVAATMYGALLLRRPHDPEIARWERSVRRFMLMSRVLDPHHYTLLAINVFYHDLWRGQTLRAGSLLKSLSGVVKSKRVGPVAVLGWYTMRSVYGHFTGDGAASLQASQEGLDYAQEHGVHFWNFLLMAQAAFGALVEGDIKTALNYLGQMEQEMHPGRPLHSSQYHDAAAQVALLRGRIPEALNHVEQAIKHAVNLGSLYPEAVYRIGASQVYFAADKRDRAYQELDAAESIIHSAGSTVLLARVHFARAEYALAEGQSEPLRRYLRLGFEACREHGYAGFPWWRSAVMARLCGEALRHDIETEFVQRLIRQRELPPVSREAPPQAWPHEVRIETLGSSFRVWCSGDPIRFSGKAQRRPMELLQAIVALGSVDVSAEVLADALYPDSEGDAAQQAVATTLHRLRRLIGARAIVRTQGMISLDLKRCHVDSHQCDRVLEALRARPNAATTLDVELVEQLFHLYRGPFLAGSPQRWAVNFRGRLAARFVARVVAEIETAERLGELVLATEWGERALEVEPTHESLYRALIAALKARGMSARAADVYRRCSESLRVHFDSMPSSETERVARGERTPAAHG